MAYDCIPVEYDPGIMCLLVTTSATGLHAQMLQPKRITGKADAGGATTIQLQDALHAPLTHFYTGWTIYIIGGTGIGQSRLVTAYTLTNYECTVATWGTNPDNTSIYTIVPPHEGLTCREIVINTATDTTRFTLNGTTPTATVGHLLAAGSNVIIKGINACQKFKIIDAGGAAAVLVTATYG